MGLVTISDEEWTSSISIKDIGDGFYEASIFVIAEDRKLALRGAELVFDLVAKDREAFIKVKPFCFSEKSTSEKVCYIGIAQVNFKFGLGNWKDGSGLNKVDIFSFFKNRSDVEISSRKYF